MFRPKLHVGLVLIALAVFPPVASAQISWTLTYADGDIGSGGIGFADPTYGQLRRDSITAALTYLNTILDGRGTVKLNFEASANSTSTPVLAYYGPSQFTGINGSFQNGGIYQAARTNQRPFSGSDGSGKFNFGYGWNYYGQTASGGNYDMVTVAIHEIGHGLGFLSGTSSTGQGLGNNPPAAGQPGIYAVFDKYLQKGNSSSGTPQFNTNVASSGYGSFTGSASIFTAGNNASTGLFFGGKYTMEVRGGTAAPLYAPNPYQDGSSTSHVADSSAVMNPSISANNVKRFLNYEIAMLMDIGWNVYNWNGNANGNWLTGVTVDSNGDTTSTTVSNSNWRTDQGIVFNGQANGNQIFNVNSSQVQAPILAPYGKVTSNIVLRFGGSGSGNYTSTNDITTHEFRLSRLELNSTSTNSTGNTISGGTLLFGRNSDGTNSILKPKIEQQNSGKFIIDSTINIAQSANGLTVDGAGSGQVTLSGKITGVGMLTRGGSGSFVLVISNSTNDYSGGTAITAGTLRLGAANVIPESGVFRLAGGTLSTGATAGFTDVLGSLEMTSNSTIALGTGSHTITFSSITGTPSGTLTITGWTGDHNSSGTQGRILISGLNSNINTAISDYASFLNNTTFTGVSTHSTFISTGTAGTYELVPAPEPATVLGIAVTALAVGGVIRRRHRREVPPELANLAC